MQFAELTLDRRVWVFDSLAFDVYEGVVIERAAKPDYVWVKGDGRGAKRYFPSDCRPTRELALLDALEGTRNALHNWSDREHEAKEMKVLAGRRLLEIQAELSEVPVEREVVA